MKYKFSGLDCAHCAANLEEYIKKNDDIKDVNINFQTKTMFVEYRQEEDLDGLLEYIHTKEADFNIHIKEDFSKELQKIKNKKLKLIFVSLIFFIALILEFRYYKTYFAIYFLAYVLVGYDVVVGAISSFKKGDFFNEKVLMSVSTIAALLIGEYEESTAVMLFYNIGEYFQELSSLRSRKEIRDLLDLNDTSVHVYSLDGTIKDEDVENVRVGEYIYVKVGERIPLDAKVYLGKSELDTSMITGESVPRYFVENDNVLAGMINLSDNLVLEVTNTFEESSIHKMVEMIENSNKNKSSVENFVTVFSKYYTPIVLILAMATIIIPPLFFERIYFRDALYNGIVLLVVSCPCSLVLSIPLTFFAGVGKAASCGILIKGTNVFDNISKLKSIYLDKTGTITDGKLKVSLALENLEIPKEKLLEYVYVIEQSSNHPIAKAINSYIQENMNLEAIRVKLDDVEQISGLGMKAICDNMEILIGNRRLLEENSIHTDFIEQATSVVYVAVNKKINIIFNVKDNIREDAKLAIDQMRKYGIEKIYMLTGDNYALANKVSKELNLDGFSSNLLPIDKLNVVKKAKEKEVVAFVGDGINDALVISESDLGIAMGKMGQDITIEVADIVLNTDSLVSISKLKKLSKKLSIIVLENLAFILLVKISVILLGIFSVISMWVAVFADVGVTVIVVLNAMRVKILKI